MKKDKKHPTKPKPQKDRPAIYATTPARIKAFIVDLFMIYVPILYIITYIFMGDKESFLSSNLAPFAAVLLYASIEAIFVSKSGQTPGKKAYEIVIVDEKTSKNISFIRAFFRFVMFLLSATTLLGLLVGLYRADKRVLHDILAKTVVKKSSSISK